jgi:hypothetical protein
MRSNEVHGDPVSQSASNSWQNFLDEHGGRLDIRRVSEVSDEQERYAARLLDSVCASALASKFDRVWNVLNGQPVSARNCFGLCGRRRREAVEEPSEDADQARICGGILLVSEAFRNLRIVLVEIERDPGRAKALGDGGPERS